MVIVSNDCVCCDTYCAHCGADRTPHYYCDKCGDEAEDMYYDELNIMLCADCISEIYADDYTEEELEELDNIFERVEMC